LKILLLSQKLVIKPMDLKLSAQIREKNEKLSIDFIPAVLYGKGVETVSLKIKRVDFDRVFTAAGESNLISLDFGSGVVKVLVKDLQRDVIKHTFTHIDFYQVNMKEKIKTEIPLHFIGESKAVKELGGMLMKEMDAIAVECLPTDLVDHIDVDISSLNTFEDSIRVSNLNIPQGLEVAYHNAEDMVAVVVKPKAVVEEQPVEEAAGSETKSAGENQEAATPEEKKE